MTVPSVAGDAALDGGAPGRRRLRSPGTDLRGYSVRLSAADADILAKARVILLKLARRMGPELASPHLVREYLIALLAPEEREFFVLVLLDNRHRVIASETLFAGTIDGARVYPREVVKCVLRHNAAAVILAHNHPSSGVLEPSQADELITRRLCESLALIDVRVLDHVVVAGADAFSFAESGRL